MTAAARNHVATAFDFTPENRRAADAYIARYPKGRQQSAVMPLLTLAQQQNDGHLSREAMDYVAIYLDMPAIRVYEVASFYTMYNLSPVGHNIIEICTTTPCWLKGSDGIVEACKKHLGIGLGETTGDGQFTLREAECLGACVNAPMMSVNLEYYEDLTPDITVKLLDVLKSGSKPMPGPQNGRRSSEPAGLPTSLTGQGRDGPPTPSASVHRHPDPERSEGEGSQVPKGDPLPSARDDAAKMKGQTIAEEAPGKHPSGSKRYSAEPDSGPKKKQGSLFDKE